ncbi:MAG: SAM-dependent methyltransferase [Campylobacterales bacterium]|nr:SAM-dependent methyltransferase [Campylobacterales bacterium]
MIFSDYMQAWLYGDEGYYTRYRPIGKSGDFYTSVSSSKFFGGTIAKHIVSLIDEGFLSERLSICEIGAHHGYLLADIIEFLYTLRPSLLQNASFVIVERFEALRIQQQNYFREAFGDAIRLLHVSDLGALHVDEAFFVANEIFDAFPCALYYKGKAARVEGHEVIFDVEDAVLAEQAAHFGKDRGEIAVGYEAFAQTMCGSARRFAFMSFDYGEMQSRSDFSLRIYAAHKVHPFFEEGLNRAALFGQSDLTYDVTFLHVKDAFEAVGAKMHAFMPQMKALIEMGLLELLETLRLHVSPELYAQELDKIKPLILPEMLGERFKMILFRKEERA